MEGRNKSNTFARKEIIMKYLTIILFILFLTIGCSHKEQSKGTNVDTVYIAPDSVWDRSYVDSLYQEVRSKSYQMYGDSNYFEDGLPDSMQLHNYR